MQDFLRILKNFLPALNTPFFRIFLCCLDQPKFQKNPVNIRYAADISQCFRPCHNRLSFRPVSYTHLTLPTT